MQQPRLQTHIIRINREKRKKRVQSIRQYIYIIMPKRQAAEPRIVDHVSDSDDEEIDEDEAFNSEDERKYGSFFDKHDSEEESDSENDDGIASDSDDEEEGDGGQYMLDLLNQLDSSSTSNDNDNSGLAVHVAESEFAASVVRGTNLTLDSLMEGLQDTRGFRDMQKTLAKVAQGKSTSAPVAKVVSDRAQRKVHYQEQTDQVSRWMEAVQENRQAESLDFRPKERMDVTKDDLVEKFVPTTDFEQELHAALLQAGQQDEDAILKREEEMMQDDDLGSNKLTMEEYKQRRAQMAKMRALMFYHEQKRHHMNKIKSKKYRRIRKKQRQRLKEAEMAAQIDQDPDMVKELEEKEEVERMKERMTLAHKNTSKWAKRVLKRGKNVDKDTRRALSAQLKRGDDLRKKMHATRDDDMRRRTMRMKILSILHERCSRIRRKIISQSRIKACSNYPLCNVVSRHSESVQRKKLDSFCRNWRPTRDLQEDDDEDEEEQSLGDDDNRAKKKKKKVASRFRDENCTTRRKTGCGLS